MCVVGFLQNFKEVLKAVYSNCSVCLVWNYRVEKLTRLLLPYIVISNIYMNLGDFCDKDKTVLCIYHKSICT